MSNLTCPFKKNQCNTFTCAVWSSTRHCCGLIHPDTTKDQKKSSQTPSWLEEIMKKLDEKITSIQDRLKSTKSEVDQQILLAYLDARNIIYIETRL